MTQISNIVINKQKVIVKAPYKNLLVPSENLILTTSHFLIHGPINKSCCNFICPLHSIHPCIKNVSPVASIFFPFNSKNCIIIVIITPSILFIYFFVCLFFLNSTKISCSFLSLPFLALQSFPCFIYDYNNNNQCMIWYPIGLCILHKLGLVHFPRTSAGLVQKSKFRMKQIKSHQFMWFYIPKRHYCNSGIPLNYQHFLGIITS